jgi:hypothetical protein
MNRKTTYEQLITEKLDDMPVPDMADAIWARIERQLDTDMPTDEGGDADPDPKGPSSGGWMIGSGLFVFVAALVTIFLINKNKNKREESYPPTTIQRNDSVLNNNEFRGDPTRTRVFNNEVIDRPATEGSPGLTPGQPAPVVDAPAQSQDTITTVPRISDPAPINQERQQDVTTVVPPPVRNDSTPSKKSRGVKGLTDNDYRIVPVNKDST